MNYRKNIGRFVAFFFFACLFLFPALASEIMAPYLRAGTKIDFEMLFSLTTVGAFLMFYAGYFYRALQAQEQKDEAEKVEKLMQEIKDKSE